MKRSMLLSAVLLSGSGMESSLAHAQGYMAFLENGPAGGTAVAPGDAGSYMRAFLEWNKTKITGNVATPTVVMPVKITTWRDTGLNLKFVIPYITNYKPDDASL